MQKCPNCSAPQLDVKTACALTELELLETHYDDFTTLEDLECTTTAALEQNGDEAVLRDLRFEKSDRKKVELVSCLHYLNKWSVAQLRADDDCSAPKDNQKKLKHE